MSASTTPKEPLNDLLRWENSPSGIVLLSGEIDLAAHELIDAICFAGNEFDVTVDLSDVTFMDCAGYRALAAAREQLTEIGGSLTIVNAGGQPERLLLLIGKNV